MGKGGKECVELIMCDECERWLVFSEKECGFSFKEAKKKTVWGMGNLEMMIEGERKKRMELNELVNVVVAELEREENVREKTEVEVRN